VNDLCNVDEHEESLVSNVSTLTEKACKQHALVPLRGDYTTTVRSSSVLKVRWETIEWSDEGMHGARQLIRWRCVLDVHCRLSIIENRDEAKHLRLAQIRAVAQTTSRLFSLWFTIVRRVIDMAVMGGVSLGAWSSFSAKGLMSFGSETVASNLHHDT
jgi:hypothetical protein